MKKIIMLVLIPLCVFSLVGCKKNHQPKGTVYLDIKCENKDLSGNYKVNDEISCNLLGTEYIIKIDEINGDKIKLSANEFGLYPKRDTGTISLTEKVKNFELVKDKELELVVQVTDVHSSIVINWK